MPDADHAAPGTNAAEEAELDAAIERADELLLASLTQDERRRRGRRVIFFALLSGGLIMGTLLVIAVALNVNAVAGNVLLNEGLEEGAKSPAHWSQGADIPGVQYIWDKKTGHKSRASLCLHKKANRYFPIAQWHQTVERKETGEALHVSARVKADQVTKAIVDVIFLDEKDEWISHKWVSYIGAKKEGDRPVTHNWKRYAGEVPIPQGATKIMVALQIYGPGKVWFDDVQAKYEE